MGDLEWRRKGDGRDTIQFPCKSSHHHRQGETNGKLKSQVPSPKHVSRQVESIEPTSCKSYLHKTQ